MKATVQIRTRYQVTVPEPIRKAFALKENDFIEVDITPIRKSTEWRNRE